MSRRRTPKKRIVMPDPVYDSRLVELLVRQLMREGKKSLAYRICYESMNQLWSNFVNQFESDCR